MDLICDIEELEHTVGGRSQAAMLKSIGELDDHARHLLGLSPLAVLGYESVVGGRRAQLVGGAPGFATAPDPAAVSLPLPADAAEGGSVALLFLIPGWRETFRINGRAGAGGRVLVEEAFLHCAKAVIRSELWAPRPASTGSVGDGTSLDDEVLTSFLAAAPFTVITSLDGSGAADASPKGDPPGFITVLGPSTVALPDRPGNRRTDTLHNVVERPEVALVGLVPGDARTLELAGTASITKDVGLLATMAVRDRVPKAALVVEVNRWAVTADPALEASAVWDVATHVPSEELPDAARIWTAHVKANRTPGAAARLARTGINRRAMQVGLDLDYRTNLY